MKAPRISVRIKPELYIALKRKYPKRGELSKITNQCLSCIINNPQCVARKRASRGQRKEN